MSYIPHMAIDPDIPNLTRALRLPCAFLVAELRDHGESKCNILIPDSNLPLWSQQNQSPESDYIHGQASQPPWKDHRLVHLQVVLDIHLAPALRAPAAVGTYFGKSARGRQSQKRMAKEWHIERQENQRPFLWPQNESVSTSNSMIFVGNRWK